MSSRNSINEFFQDLGNGVAKAVDIVIGSEPTRFTEKLNRGISDMEESFNGLGNPPPYGYGQPPYQNGYPGYPGGAPGQGMPGQQYGYQGNGMGYAPGNGGYMPGNDPYRSPNPNPNVYVNNGPQPNGQYGQYGNPNPYGYAPPPPPPRPQSQPPPKPLYGQGGRCVPPEALLNDGSPITRYVTVSESSGKGMSFELPPEFVEMSTGSGAEMFHMYRADEGDFRSPRLVKPYICIIPAGGGIPLAEDCTSACIGLMEIRSKGWVNYRGKAARYYGFTRRDESRQLLVLFCEPNVVGTPLGNKMITVLDHAAETYREG
ncbi:MAG: hypothetical protein K6B74_02845 [Ruminococcus sp.]|nr:hypothetical protein [Ruminococcus sp.]